MHVNISGLGFRLTQSLSEHARDRASRALAPASRQIRQVAVRLGDVNGPRGGEDKTCRIIAWMRHGMPIVVEATHQSMYAAIDAAADRARELLRRRFSRRRTIHRGAPREAAPAFI